MKTKNIFAVLLMALTIYSCGKKEEQPVKKGTYKLAQKAEVPEFNADTAYHFIEKQLSFGPRNPNSLGHKLTLEYLNTTLRGYADAVEIQNFTYPGYDNMQLHLSNIIARFNPSSKERIFLCAHWDTRPRADQDNDKTKQLLPILGANDGGSGVGILLELARQLKMKKPDYGIDLIFFDGEDYGKENDLDNYCLGSKYFAAQKGFDYNPSFGILLDLVGDKDAVFMREGNSVSFAPDIVDMLWKIAAAKGADAFRDSEGSAIYDDHIPLNQAGLKTIDIIDIELVGGHAKDARRNYWHTHKDNMENIGKNTLKQVGNVLTTLIYSLKFE